MSAGKSVNHRILVIDDVAEIHTVFRRLLSSKAKPAALASIESALFEKSETPPPDISFEVDTALQGKQGLALVQSALAEGRPHAMAFVDMRMPPGWDGLETIEAIWRIHPDMEMVICTAYSDYSDVDIVKRLGPSDQVLFLRKPFDAIEVRQLARALSEKWSLRQQARLRQAELERRVATRTRELSAVNLRLVEETQQKEVVDHELQCAQKLEAVGRLTAAIAAELDSSLKVLSAAVDDARLHLPADPLKHELTTSSARALADATTAAGDATRRMAGLVRGLTKLASESPSPRAELDVNRALAGVAEVMRDSISACALLETDYGALPPISCSPADLNLVLIGLIDSAVQAVESAKHKTGHDGRISISTRAEDGQGVITISDTGEPIPDHLQARVFEPFFAAQDGVRQGLAIARTIIESNAGRVTLESTSGGGSTVCVRLPAKSVQT